MSRIFNGLLAILLATSVTAPLLVTIAVAEPSVKPVAPNPDFYAPWPEGTLWGTNLRLENIHVGESWFGVGLNPACYEVVAPPMGMWPFLVENGITFRYDTVVRQLDNTPPQTYSWYIDMRTWGGAPSAGTLSWVLENSTHSFIPQDFSVVLENQAEGIFVNLWVVDNYHVPSLPVYATLYVDNFVPEVDISVSPPSKEGARGGATEYTVTVTSLAESPDNFDSIPAASFSYDLTVSDNLGWNLTLTDNVLENVLPGENRTTTLSVIIPDNVTPGTGDYITVIATSRTDPWVSDNASCIALAGEEIAFHLPLVEGWNLVSFAVTNENTTPDNLFDNVDYAMRYWQAPYGPYREPFPDQPVEDNLGYWVKLDNDKTITLYGERPENRTIYLLAGWNLVHFPLTSENTTPDNLFAGMTYTMRYWEAPYGPYRAPFPDHPVQLGVGYWVLLDNDRTVTIPL